MKTVEVKEILRIGTNIDLSNSKSKYSISELKEFARAVEGTQNSHLTISSDGLSVNELKELARIGRSRLTIIFL